jgi:hypothetical protein
MVSRCNEGHAFFAAALLVGECPSRRSALVTVLHLCFVYRKFYEVVNES